MLYSSSRRSLHCISKKHLTYSDPAIRGRVPWSDGLRFGASIVLGVVEFTVPAFPHFPPSQLYLVHMNRGQGNVAKLAPRQGVVTLSDITASCRVFQSASDTNCVFLRLSDGSFRGRCWVGTRGRGLARASAPGGCCGCY